MNAASEGPVGQYFASIRAALAGLEIFLGDRNSPLYRDTVVGEVVIPYLSRLKASFSCWENRIGFIEQFRISRAESGFPVFQNVLELENDRQSAEKRLAGIPAADALRQEMADFILRQKAFPGELQSRMAERLYLEQIGKGDIFSPFIMPETIRVGVNPKTMRPYYVVCWGAFDGTSTLPMVYMSVIEDSSEKIIKLLVTPDGKLNPDTDIPLPIGGLLNPDLASRFDDFALKNSAYSLTPVTIATNLDKDFEELHPKQLRRIVLGPFYSAGITENNAKINDILSKVRKTENAWLLTWTVQEVFSKAERPAQRGFFSSTPASEEFHIDTDNLEATRMGVSSYEKHALVPHDAYQALYAAGDAAAIFGDYKVHVISGNQVISEV
ncbi:hypothetical protein LJR098_004360 [Rhizobium sp. LjRoot98]|uniref:hypothetical protein n=1 Tax=unclassified Rhizobium TaxID=2613769 RepID=UPI00071332E1|nr:MULTISPECIES: hypothetical protein [unclassified Rhizobium]KQV29839.1 hypothetical protein ASC96_10440 [Rhizobium sp. Root1204]KQY05029.1 hypothetical protein ASD36_11260 [Rhizobium sp. Root1334]KRC01668.1 hypothetical protein ASE23_09045 [Rhizobium sp. Root73]